MTDVNTGMFNNYQNIDPDYVPDNSEVTAVTNTLVPMSNITAPNIIVNGINKEIIYSCNPGDKLLFEVTGKIYNDDKTEVNLTAYLTDKKVNFNLYSFRMELLYVGTATASESILIELPTSLSAGIYHCSLDLMTADNVFLTKLFDTLDSTISVIEQGALSI